MERAICSATLAAGGTGSAPGTAMRYGSGAPWKMMRERRDGRHASLLREA